MSERNLDFVETRNHVRNLYTWPLNFVFGLQTFQTVQHMYNFAARSIFAVSSIIPFAKTYHPSHYVETTCRLTRFRNHHDQIL